MQIHRHRKKLQSVAGYLLIFIIVFVSASFFFRAKDNADTDYLEQVSKKSDRNRWGGRQEQDNCD